MANKEFRYLCCLNCGHARVLKNFRLEPFPIDPLKFYVLRVREQYPGGYDQEKRGFFDLPNRAKTMTDLWNSQNPSERELAETMKQRLLSIVQAYRSVGIIKLEELK